MAIQTLNTIKKWFKTGLKPSQDQFWDTWDSFRHKYEKVPIKDVEGIETALDTKAEKSQLDEHKTDVNAHSELFTKKEDNANKGAANGYVPLDEVAKIASKYLNIVNNLVSGGATSLLSAEQGVVLQNQIDLINNLLKSDNANLNTVQKIVDIIEEIQLSLNSILVNDLTTGGATKALTAEMGKILQSNKEDKSQKGISGGYAPLNSFTKLASQYLDIANDLVSGGTESILSAEQGKILQNQINVINTLLSSDDINLDTLQEIVDAIKNVQYNLKNILVNDLTTGGVNKALTAEMGKQLNIDKLTATIATDAETQIISAVVEDNKIISRSKLFNWFSWIKTQAQTISASWTFNLNLRLASAGYLTSDIYGLYVRAFSGKRLCLGVEGGSFESVYIDATGVQMMSKITLISGSTTTPALIIPNGTLTTTPQNGAIERDSNGKLWNTVSGVRSELVPSRTFRNIGGFNLSVDWLFKRQTSIVNEGIELADQTGLGKLYSVNFNSRDELIKGDIIDSELVMQNNSVNAESFVLSIETWQKNSDNSTTKINTFDYILNFPTASVLTLRIIYRREATVIGYYSTGYYAFFINNMYVSYVPSFINYGNNEIRIKMINKNEGKPLVNITSLKATNLLIPIS